MTANTELAERALARISRRLIPFLFILYVFAYLDRVNVGYAALFIRRELNFSDTVYGTGAGLFFLSYAIFEIPSTLILMSVGSCRCIGILVVAWGLISASMPLARTPAEFYALRFLLGAAEAGFFPGIVLYFTAWFPKQLKARTLARFMSATAIAGVVGAPFSNLLLRLHGVAGIAGWKWLFVGEGVPSIFLGLLVFWVLTDTPADATWLPHDEQQWLIETLAAEQAGISATHSVHLREIWRNPAMWQLSAIYFLVSAGFYSLSLWLPVVLKQISGASASRVILLTAIPWAIATVVMLIIAHFSRRQPARSYGGLRIKRVACESIARNCLAFARSSGSLGLSRAILGAAYNDAARHSRCRRNRYYQFSGRARRILRTISYGHRERCNAQLSCRAGNCVCLVADCCRNRLETACLLTQRFCRRFSI